MVISEAEKFSESRTTKPLKVVFQNLIRLYFKLKV